MVTQSFSFIIPLYTNRTLFFYASFLEMLKSSFIVNKKKTPKVNNVYLFLETELIKKFCEEL